MKEPENEVVSSHPSISKELVGAEVAASRSVEFTYLRWALKSRGLVETQNVLGVSALISALSIWDAGRRFSLPYALRTQRKEGGVAIHTH